jgi:hypothetical protein
MARWSYEGQICIDGFDHLADLEQYLADNGGMVEVKMFAPGTGERIVLIACKPREAK